MDGALQLEQRKQHYQEYRNDRWHFSVFIPDSWKVAAEDVPGGQTLTFLDPAGKDQFEISAWPYSDLDSTRLQPASDSTDQPERNVSVG